MKVGFTTSPMNSLQKKKSPMKGFYHFRLGNYNVPLLRKKNYFKYLMRQMSQLSISILSGSHLFFILKLKCNNIELLIDDD